MKLIMGPFSAAKIIEILLLRKIRSANKKAGTKYPSARKRIQP